MFPEIIPIRGSDAPGPRLLPTLTFRGEAVNEGEEEVVVKSPSKGLKELSGGNE